MPKSKPFKPNNKPSSNAKASRATNKSAKLVAAPPRGEKNTGKPSKQERVIGLLRSPSGASIATMMQGTGWQQHSVRGFLAGVVRKKLKLKLDSEKVDGERVYRIQNGPSPKSSSNRNATRAAA